MDGSLTHMQQGGSERRKHARNVSLSVVFVVSMIRKTTNCVHPGFPTQRKRGSERERKRAKQEKAAILLLFTFYNCIVSVGFLPWEIRDAFRSKGKASCDRIALPNRRCMLECFCVSITHYRIFNVCTDVNVWDCTRGCTDTVKESALKVDSGRKIPCPTGESNLRHQRAGPTLYQLSYIRIPVLRNEQRLILTI